MLDGILLHNKTEVEYSAESADFVTYSVNYRAGYVLLHEFNGSVSRCDINSCVFVCFTVAFHFFMPFHLSLFVFSEIFLENFGCTLNPGTLVGNLLSKQAVQNP